MTTDGYVKLCCYLKVPEDVRALTVTFRSANGYYGRCDTLYDDVELSVIPRESVPETAEELPGEVASLGTEEDIPSETQNGNATFEQDEEAWDNFAEAPADTEEMLASGLNETLEAEDYEASDNTINERREEDVSPRPPSPTIRARELLAQGMSSEEVAKETGMGRSAVELLAQMAQGKLNSQEND